MRMKREKESGREGEKKNERKERTGEREREIKREKGETKRTANGTECRTRRGNGGNFLSVSPGGSRGRTCARGYVCICAKLAKCVN